MCNDPTHDPTPVLGVVQAEPGINTDRLHKALYALGITNQPARVGLAVSEGLIHRKRKGKGVGHYPGRHSLAGKKKDS